MPQPTETRQLPGVKGQFILCAECPPIQADADSDGDVCIAVLDGLTLDYQKWNLVRPDQYWRTVAYQDYRLFVLKPAPSWGNERKIVQLVCHAKGQAIYAVADDGTAWISSQEHPEWIEMAPLPDREVSDG